MTSPTLQNVLQYLKNFESFSIENHLIPNLCQCSLIRAKLSTILLDFDLAIKDLNSVVKLSKTFGLPSHLRLANQDLELISQIKKNMKTQSGYDKGKNIHPDEALNYLRDLHKLLNQND